MNVNGPFFNRYRANPGVDPYYRIEEASGAEDREQRQKRSRAFYKGHHWEPKKDRYIFISPRNSILQQSSVNWKAVEKARKLLQAMTSVEEKVAQLCLCQTEALYDTEQQQHVERLIQGWQIGGLVFQEGDYRRQNYLIEHYQNLSKTPLLMGNDFLHSLSFYFRDEETMGNRDQKRFEELGKAITGLNRSLSVHFQFDQERSLSSYDPQDECARFFRKGIKEARGIVASITAEKKCFVRKRSNSQSQNYNSIKTLRVLDLTAKDFTEEQLIEALRNGYHAFLGSTENISRIMTLLGIAVMKGKLSEKELDDYVMKLLYLKSTLPIS